MVARPRLALPAAAQAAASERVRDRYASAMREYYAGGVFYSWSIKINEFNDLRSYEYWLKIDYKQKSVTDQPVI